MATAGFKVPPGTAMGMSDDEIPEPFFSTIKRVVDDDRQWFKNHPTEQKRVRAFVPGEAWPESPDCQLVTVIKMSGDLRARVFHEHPLPEDE